MRGNACQQRQSSSSGGQGMELAAAGVAPRQPGRWRWVRIPALAAGLLLIERQLLAVMGTPTAQIRALRDLGLSPTDAVTPLLAVLAFLAEALIGYVVVILCPPDARLAAGLHRRTDRPGRAPPQPRSGPQGARPAGRRHAPRPGDADGDGRRTTEPRMDSICVITASPVSSVRFVGSIGPTGPATRMWLAGTQPAETQPPPAG